MSRELGLAEDDGHVVWEEDVWDAARAADAEAALARTGPILPTPRVTAATFRIARSWEAFFSRHGATFFKDRAWLERDFPALRNAENRVFTLLEFGCGTGAAFIPLLRRLPCLYVTAFDISKTAVQLAAAQLSSDMSLSRRGVVFVHDALTGDTGAAVRTAHVIALRAWNSTRRGDGDGGAACRCDGGGGDTTAPRGCDDCQGSADLSDDAVSSVWLPRSSRSEGPVQPQGASRHELRGGCVSRRALERWLSQGSDRAQLSSLSTPTAAVCPRTRFSPRFDCGFDAALMLFMASAVPPARVAALFVEAAANLRPGGELLVRDYGAFDAAELRFGTGQRLGRHLFMRSDGTLAAFFEVSQLKRWAAAAGLHVRECRYLHRKYANRALGITLRRVFVHGIFVKPIGGGVGIAALSPDEYAICLAAGATGAARG